MKFNYGYLLKSLPIWVPLTLLSAAFLLITIIPRFFSSYFTPYNQMAYISDINGDVNLSDGISDVSAQNGALTARSTRVLLKTGNGNANLKMRDGSFVILGSSSIMEFNREYMKAPGESFAFNLVSGRALVINGQDANIPTQVFVGGNITAQVFQAVIGLEVQENDNIHQQVDCLIGPCLVNGILQLVSGQSASIGLDGAVQVTRKIPYDSWISLGKVGAFNSAISSIFADLHPTITPTVTAIFTPVQTPKMIRTPFGITGTPSPAMTNTVQPKKTQTSTLTATSVYQHPFPTFTSQPTNVLPSTSTPVSSSTPIHTRTPFPTQTPFPSSTSYPTASFSPQPSDTPFPTETLPPEPTSTQLPTDTFVPIPTDTLGPTIAPTKKHTPKPTHTVEPPPTSTPPDTPVPTEVPIPTDTPIPPTNVPIPTDTQPPPTNVPVPTDTQPPPTDVPVPTDTPVASNLSPFRTTDSHRKNSGLEMLMG